AADRPGLDGRQPVAPRGHGAARRRRHGPHLGLARRGGRGGLRRARRRGAGPPGRVPPPRAHPRLPDDAAGLAVLVGAPLGVVPAAARPVRALRAGLRPRGATLVPLAAPAPVVGRDRELGAELPGRQLPRRPLGGDGTVHVRRGHPPTALRSADQRLPDHLGGDHGEHRDRAGRGPPPRPPVRTVTTLRVWDDEAAGTPPRGSARATGHWGRSPRSPWRSPSRCASTATPTWWPCAPRGTTGIWPPATWSPRARSGSASTCRRSATAPSRAAGASRTTTR